MDSRIAATVAGAAATAPMTAVMMALQQVLPGEAEKPLPPRVITENLADSSGAGNDTDEGTLKAATLAGHFSFGAAAGVAYVPLAGKSGLPAAAEGALFGLAVWGGSYLGLMPATGLYQSAREEPGPRNLLMITAHVVWGASLGILYDVLRKRNIEGL